MENTPTSATTPDTIHTNDSNQENDPKMEQVVPIEPARVEPEAKLERRGRPAGAKDKAPRKSRVV